MQRARLDRAPAKAGRRQVAFVVRSLQGDEVSITGDFTQWSPEGIPLRREANGEFRTTLQLEPGEYQYRLRVDGRWVDDPEASRRVPNGYGSENCVLEVPTR